MISEYGPGPLPSTKAHVSLITGAEKVDKRVTNIRLKKHSPPPPPQMIYFNMEFISSPYCSSNHLMTNSAPVRRVPVTTREKENHV